MLEKTFSRVSLEDQVYKFIKEMILSGAFLSGQLYSESEIAKQLKVSRSPIRAAVRSLERDGLVKVLTNRGFYIHQFDEKGIRNVFELRKALESFAIERFMQQKGETNELRKTINELTKSAKMKDLGVFMEEDGRFHYLLIKETNNARIEEIYADLRTLISALGLWALQGPGVPEQTIEEHSRILDAIVVGDLSGAKEALYQHFDKAARLLTESILDFYQVQLRRSQEV